MFCKNCVAKTAKGKFCHKCGAKLSADSAHVVKRLYRSGRQKIIAGVCGGIAEYLNIDVTIVRIAFVLLAFVWGMSIFAYILLALVLPENP